ncbi:hypothetical protein [Gallaecimonas xiamenensis]|uniref:Uncharacterized protein n=1 Tax=Gallaecimonas xiamenensis 3-C-1 TaxID=745411 RepID=K2KES1_9GAMM|nr:hypothetical protein [Gallaecimonas xiamenensis]EKE75845.1 hypothetical protein B3C1_05282 [Gallaecimonas xiamenensis 3-C-1]
MKAWWQRYLDWRQRQYCRRQLARAFAQQLDSARHKEEQAWHWGRCGAIERQALARCQVLLAWPRGESLGDFLARCRPALAALAQDYRLDPSDPDGYGLGTVRHFERLLEGWQP